MVILVQLQCQHRDKWRLSTSHHSPHPIRQTDLEMGFPPPRHPFILLSSRGNGFNHYKRHRLLRISRVMMMLPYTFVSGLSDLNHNRARIPSLSSFFSVDFCPLPFLHRRKARPLHILQSTTILLTDVKQNQSRLYSPPSFVLNG